LQLDCESSSWYVAAGQATGNSDPSGQYEPAGHRKLIGFATVCPGGQ